MAFDLQGALNAGAKKEDIAKYLSQVHKYDYQGAVSAGANPDEVLGYLSNIEQNAPQAEKPKGQNFFQRMISDPLESLIVKPAVRFADAIGSTGLQALDKVTGGKVDQFTRNRTGQGLDERLLDYQKEDKNIEIPVLGNMKVEGQKQFGEGGGKQIIGESAESASYLAGGGGSAMAVGSKPLYKAVAKETAVGAGSGALYSFGQAIQQAESQPADIAYQTLFGGVAGGALGLVTPLIPASVKGAKDLKKKLTNIDELDKSLYDTNKQIFKPTSTQQARWSEKKVDPIKTFTQEFGADTVPTTKDGKMELGDLIEQTDARYRAGAEGFNTILRNSPEVVSLNTRESLALDAIQRSELTPSQKMLAKDKVRTEMNALRDEARAGGHLLGDDNVKVAYADNLKDRFWGATRNFGSEESTVANAVNKNLGFAFKEGIEEAVTDTNVRQFNKKLQELIELRDFLEAQNGKNSGLGGKMTKLMARTVGATVGVSGGPLSSFAGMLTADALVSAMIRPDARTWLIRAQLAKLPQAERLSLQKEAEKILQSMAEKRMQMLALPAPKPLGSVENPIIPPAPTTYEAPAKSARTTSTNKTGDAYVRDLKTGKTQIVPRKK